MLMSRSICDAGRVAMTTQTRSSIHNPQILSLSDELNSVLRQHRDLDLCHLYLGLPGHLLRTSLKEVVYGREQWRLTGEHLNVHNKNHI